MKVSVITDSAGADLYRVPQNVFLVN